MRLIDADALPRHKQLEAMGNGKYEDVEVVYANDIDNAPTMTRGGMMPSVTDAQRRIADGKGKTIAFELLGMYKRMAATVIWEYSTDIEVDMERLEKECQEYEDRIRRSSDD